MTAQMNETEVFLLRFEMKEKRGAISIAVDDFFAAVSTKSFYGRFLHRRKNTRHKHTGNNTPIFILLLSILQQVFSSVDTMSINR